MILYLHKVLIINCLGGVQIILGQLGRRFTTDTEEYFKPSKVIYPSNIYFTEISIGFQHSLALGSDGFVYGWGCNIYGEIGCGKRYVFMISKAVRLEKFKEFSVKSIHCSFNNSFALTYDGLVYSWGRSDFYCLGLELNIKENVFEPQLINISNVISIAFNPENTYFLKTDGSVFFCGLYQCQNNIKSIQNAPKLMTEGNFSSLHYIPILHSPKITATAVSHRNLYRLNRNLAEKYENKTIHQLYFEKFKLTAKTLTINSKKYHRNEDSLIYQTNDIKQSMGPKVFKNRFTELQELGSGDFGRVMKVIDINTQTIFAMKEIHFKGYH